MKFISMFLIPSLCLFSTTSFAEIRINGFGSIYGGQTLDKDDVFIDYDNELNFETDSLFAIQISADVSDDLSATAQIISRGKYNWDAEFEWAYLSYNVSENLNIKAGRLRFPNYYYSEFIDVGYAYHWIKPPNDVYASELTSYDGISALYTTYLGDFEHKLLLGFGSAESFTRQPGNQGDFSDMFTINYDVNYNAYTAKLIYLSGELDFRNPGLDGLANIFSPISEQYVYDHVLMLEDRTSYLSFALNADWGSFFALGEYALLDFEREYMHAHDEKRFMLSGGYRFNDFTLHYTYSSNKSEDPENVVSDIPAGDAYTPLRLAAAGILVASRGESETHTFGIRYDFHPSAAAKLEYISNSEKISDVDLQLIRFGVDFVF